MAGVNSVNGYALATALHQPGGHGHATDLLKKWKWSKSFQTPNLLCPRRPKRGWLKHLFFLVSDNFFTHLHLHITVQLHSWSKVGKAHWRKWHHGAIKFFNNSWKKFATCTTTQLPLLSFLDSSRKPPICIRTKVSTVLVFLWLWSFRNLRNQGENLENV